jgi:signal transduction histidine kinase
VIVWLTHIVAEITAENPLARSLYDHMVNLAGVYATLGLMSDKLPIRVWCEKPEDDTHPNVFYLYSHLVEGEVKGFSPMIEAMVQAVASQYFGTKVEFERLAIQGEDGSPFHKWKITEIPIPGKALTAAAEHDLEEKHLVLEVGLSPQQLDNFFPFHLVFDSSLTIVQAGEQSLQSIANVRVGAKMTDIFDIVKDGTTTQDAFSWDDLQAQLRGEEEGVSTTSTTITPSGMIIDFRLSTTLEHTGKSFGLVGPLHVSAKDGYAVFLCCPDVTNLGVVMQDLSKADQNRLQMTMLVNTLQGMQLTTEKREAYVNHLKEALNRAKEKLITKQSFVRYVSHEIRTPLTVVSTGLQLIKAELLELLKLLKLLDPHTSQDGGDTDTGTGGKQGKEDEKAAASCVLPSASLGTGSNLIASVLDIIDDCRNSMRVAIDILNDLLAYEKIESGVFQLNKIPLLADNFIEATVGEFEVQVRETS